MSSAFSIGTRRRWALIAIPAAILLVAAFSWVLTARSADVLDKDGVALLVEGRDLNLDGRSDSGDRVGLGGTLGLLGTRCVGFADSQTLLAWPAGTELVATAKGGAFEVRVGDKTFHAGDEVQGSGGTPSESDELRRSLPEPCRSYKIVSFVPGG